MKVCVIGGANVDITATSAEAFRFGDSNPGRVEVSWGGVGRNIAHNLALLGDEVELLTIFGGGLFGPVIAGACKDLGIGISHSEIAAEGTNSFFVSINNADGELVGGVADMNATEGMTPQWLEKRLEVINNADAVVADANSSAESLAWLIDHCEKPLFLDAVSVAKAGRIREAVNLSQKKKFFALKCNAIENVELASVTCCQRRYVSLGAEGLKVTCQLSPVTSHISHSTFHISHFTSHISHSTFLSSAETYEFPALPSKVRNVTGGGDALLAGIVHAGPDATVEESARWGLECARCAVESPHAVSPQISLLH